nr:reverse transcriptase domain-containing protein [Tanacetum cinerariifolium]
EIEDDNLRKKLLNDHLLIDNIEALKDNPTQSSEFLTKSSSTSLNSLLEETNTFHNSLPEFENFYFDLGEISSGSTTTHSNISLSDYEAFYFNNNHIKEISSGSTTTHSNISLSEYDSFIFDFANEEFADELAHIIPPPEYDCFYFWNLPDPGELMFIFNFEIRENLSTTSMNSPVKDDHSPLLAYVASPLIVFVRLSLVNLPIEDDYSPLLGYVVWIFVVYLTYAVIPPYLHPFGNEDTIFDPGITINHYISFEPGLSHRHGAFKKFNTHRMDECLALADLSASINLIPFSMWEELSLSKLTLACMTLEFTDRSVSKPIGIAKDVSFKVGVFQFLADFVVVDFEQDPRVSLILERCFLKTGRALIDVHKGELTLRIGKEAITYNLDQTVRYSVNYDQMTANKIDVICEIYSQEVLGFSDVTASGNPTPDDDPIVSTTSPTLTPFGDSDFLLLKEANAFLGLEDDPDSPKINPFYYNPEGDILLLETILNSEPLPPFPNHEQYLPSYKKELKVCEAKTIKSSVDELPEVELKDLPHHLEYAFLEGTNKLPVIIAKELGDEEKSALIKGINPEFCTHKILMEEDYKPAVQHQRRVNPKIYDVIKKEVEKLLDAGLIYPITDSPWVSPVHCVPKKGGFTVVENEENELIPTRLVTGWWMVSPGIFKFPLTLVIKKRQRSPVHMARLPTVACLSACAMLRALFKDVMLKYGVTHRLSTAYHPQTSGQVKVSNRGLKRILERTIGENRAFWSDNLDDALWAFRTAYKTPIGCTPYKIVYGKTCHLLIELEHKAYWALKQANFDLSVAGYHRKVQLNELNELCNHAYENSLIYKEKTKRIHDSKIKNRVFNVGDRVLFFKSRLKIFSGKLKTRWSGPFTIAKVFPYGMVELSQANGPNFKVNGHRVKHYFGGDVPHLGSQFNHNITTKDKNPKPNPSSYHNNIPLLNKDKFLDLSFSSVTNGIAKPTVDTSSTKANIRALVLDDQDLIHVEDPSMVLLVKLNDVNSMSNMYVICRNEERVLVEVHGVNYDVHVHELGTWNRNIVDEILDSFDDINVNGMEKVKDSVDENSLADLNNLKETINELASNKIQHPISKENIDQEDDINNNDNLNKGSDLVTHKTNKEEVIEKLKFVAKGETICKHKYGIKILVAMLSQTIKESADYLNYLAKSQNAQSGAPILRRGREVDEAYNDQLKLKLKAAEQVSPDSQLLSNLKKSSKANIEVHILKQILKGPGEGSSAVLDSPDHSDSFDTSVWESSDDDKIESDNDDDFDRQ